MLLSGQRSVVDLTVELEKPATYEEICTELRRRAEGDMKGILGFQIRRGVNRGRLKEMKRERL